MTPTSSAAGVRTRAAAVAADVLARYPTGIGTDELLVRVCRDERIDVFEADLRDIAGVLRHEGATWRIYLSRQDAPHRRRLTLAHLLGHYFLHAAAARTFVARMGGDDCEDGGRSLTGASTS